jgi:hypothetical protein
MKNLRLKSVMRAENQGSAVPQALASLCHNIAGHARFAVRAAGCFKFERHSGARESAIPE